MSHLHFCEITGHEWVCEGTALRPDAGDTKPSVCMCMQCQTPLEQGDHSKCPVELVICPAHLAEFHQWVRDSHGEAELLDLPVDADETIGAALDQLEAYEAACLWCGHGYDDYSAKAEDEHFAYNCPDAPEELRELATKRLLLADYDSCESSEEKDGHAETR